MQLMEQKDKQIKQFADKSPCVCFNIRKASRIITHIYDEMFKELGLTASQAIIINSAKMIGPMTVTQMADALATDRTTITRNLKPLERDGFIKICTGNDRRSREIIITEKGVKASEQLFAIFQKFQSRAYEKIGKERLEKVCSELSAVMEEIKEL